MSPSEKRDWRSFKYAPGEYVIDMKQRRVVQLGQEPPLEILQKSGKSGILFPNWQWCVTDVVHSKSYTRTEYWLIPLSWILSWRVTKKNRVLIECFHAGNHMKLENNPEEILSILEKEIGDKKSA